MKRFLIALLIVALSFLVACGNSETEETTKKTKKPATKKTTESLEKPTKPKSETETSKETEEETEAVETQQLEVSFSGRDIVVAGAELSKASDDTPIVRVYYDVTNTTDADVIRTLYTHDIKITGFQNNEEITSSISRLDNVVEYSNYNRSIYPGVTLRVAQHFVLVDEKSDVKLVIAGRSDEEPLEVTLNLSNLPEILPKPEIVPIPQPGDISNDAGYSGTEAVIESPVLGKYNLKLLDHDFFEHKGDSYIRLFLEFTILDSLDDDETKNAFSVTRYHVYQDGIELGEMASFDDSTFGMDKLPEYDEFNTKVGLNEPVVYAVVTKLRSDSDVIVKVTTYFSDPVDGEAFIGGVFPVE